MAAGSSVPAAAGDDPAYLSVEQLLRTRLVTAFGGWRGAVESALPTLVFVPAWNVTQNVVLASGAAVAVAVLVGLVRLAQRQTLRYVSWSVIGVVIAAVIAVRTGRAQDAFLPGMIQTGLSGLFFAVTNLIRWPVFGFLIAAGDPELAQTSARLRASGSRAARIARAGLSEDERAALEAAEEADAAAITHAFTSWRRHPGIVRVAARLGWVLVALAAVRLAVQIPLYLQGQVEALGVAKLVLGWPAYLVAVAVAILVVLRGHTPLDLEGAEPTAS